jgi:hypothetical protein
VTMIGMFWLSRLSADIAYVTGPMILIGAGQGAALALIVPMPRTTAAAPIRPTAQATRP